MKAAPPALEDCTFYHTLHLPTLGRQEGQWDLTGRFDDYIGHIPLEGRTVLDVGTASGYLTWEAEARGATVTSFDIDKPEHFFMLPVKGSHRQEDPEGWLAWQTEWIRRTRNGYWLAHHEFASTVECVYGNIYDDLGPELGLFDVVLVGQLLVHLPDAVNALAAAASVCRDTLVVTEGSFRAKKALALLSDCAPSLPYSWYHYSHGWYRRVLRMLGFEKVTITTGSYLCDAAGHRSSQQLATIVGRRGNDE